jgi:hypothetical protein
MNVGIIKMQMQIFHDLKFDLIISYNLDLSSYGQLLSFFRSTVDENIIATIKMRNNFCYPLKMIIFPILR